MIAEIDEGEYQELFEFLYLQLMLVSESRSRMGSADLLHADHIPDFQGLGSFLDDSKTVEHLKLGWGYPRLG